jgi:hypothetical protein
VLQEREGIARDAKIMWGKHTHNPVHNLQHDGVIIAARDGNSAVNIAALETALTHVVTVALGYKQNIMHKPHDT